jgi:hypothetical protein
METLIPTLSPADRFNSLIEGLFSDITTKATNPWFPLSVAQLVLIKLIWRRLRRMSRRFAAILVRFRADTPPEADSAPDHPAASSRPSRGPRPEQPSQRLGWVIHAVSWFVWNRHYDLEEMLEHPGMATLVADAPQLGSVLRPLCRMLHVKPPAWLRLPRRPRRMVEKFPPAPEWLVNEPGAILKPDGTVWMHLGSSTHWKPGSALTLEEARKLDPPIRIWPRRV